jgi:hypothetical protein
MPRATVAIDNERYELASCPEGFVVVRRMTYGEKLNRTDDMMNMHTSGAEDGMQIQMMSKRVALQDFANLVVEHNLTDENDKPLNFKNAADVLRLDPRIGDEIGQLIDKLNSFEGAEETKK